MRKEILIVGLCLLILLVGCSNECCNCCYNCPTPYNTYVVCDDQDVWENRVNYDKFDCKCDNTGCRAFPSKRECDASHNNIVDGKVITITQHITCTEVVGVDRRHN